MPERGWRAAGGSAWQQRLCRRCTQRVHASFFGVGAPEALMVGVVALIVFGPKGLAEAVKSLGKTLKTFQPTIRELASVSSDLKNTLEEQIGLDDIRAEFRNSTAPDLSSTSLEELEAELERRRAKVK
ncbi:hypothetical protein WJX81_001635 [Elliptochloris bilobata]|uniref:Uncharacterized protein n=1 Tax=Elliptochloris bilobata TaxID=381761 RepID=A0AAW1RN22_9CHLO